MRKLLLLAAVSAVAFGFLGIGPAVAKPNPVNLDGKVDAQGTKDIEQEVDGAAQDQGRRLSPSRRRS